MELKFADKEAKAVFVAMVLDAHSKGCYLGGMCIKEKVDGKS